ncbi:MAG TPA: 2Fe-2S iron-sulfur cluster-binding protein [Afifellaceae bacterium]|nr:2Fe-2S iron-sulfur cluster-binding protein [Afifellaceae bacterium]
MVESSPTITINGTPVAARNGETLIDAGLGGRILIPHDCCSGQCDTCRVTVVDGEVDANGTAESRTVLACQATVRGSASIVYDEVPVPVKRVGRVSAITPLTDDILEVCVTIVRSLEYLPGQYLSVQFNGFPARDYSPTVHMDGELNTSDLVFHIKQLRDGLVSSQLGRRIRVGHRVRIRGPLGNAFLRKPAANSMIVLVSAGTGWAPIWSIARAACLDHKVGDLAVIAGARDGSNLYMGDALHWLRDHGVRDIVTTCSTNRGPDDRPGRPFHYLPTLGLDDTVYVAGGPGVVAEVSGKALAAGARCFPDPFLQSGYGANLFHRISNALRLHGPAAAL